MKRTLVFVILIAFLTNSMGYYILFELNRFLIRKEMETHISGCSSVPVRLTIEDPVRNRDFKRINKKEFLYHGKLYDIVSEINSGKNIILLCFPDHKEDKLLKDFRGSTSKKISQMLLDHLIKIAFCHPVISLNTVFPVRLEYPLMSIRLTRVSIPPLLPPPRHC